MHVDCKHKNKGCLKLKRNAQMIFSCLPSVCWTTIIILLFSREAEKMCF